MTDTGKKVGRPSGRTQDRPFQMRVNEEFMRRIDDWRRVQPDLPHRAEAIRRLVELALSGHLPKQPGGERKGIRKKGGFSKMASGGGKL